MAQTLVRKYKETLDYMFTKLPMFQRIGAAAYKKDLTNIIALCKFLDDPHLKFPSIHIAGTNGKGSTSHMLAACFQAKGLKTGLYISPHYKDYRERIKVNGKYVSRKFVVEFIENLKPLIEEISPSFFEINVAMAFSYFAYKKVDIAIIETGLGGRLDSTNIVNPVMSVITNISYDHMNLLGDTLPEIAFEKAGIIKKSKPVIIGERQDEVIEVFQKKAKECNADIIIASDLIKIKLIGKTFTHNIFNVTLEGKPWIENLELDLKGSFQEKNLVTVLATIRHYNQIKHAFFSISDIRNAIKNVSQLTSFIGRWQTLGENPLIICDSGHNEAGIDYIISQLKELNYNRLHFVIGVVNDKEIDKMLSKLPKEAQYYFAKANVPRGLDAKILQEKAKQFQLKGRHYTSVKNAFKAAKSTAAREDLIFIGGSIFVVGEIL